MDPKYLNEMSAKIYEQNKAVGWWDNPNRCLFECLQLVSTEVAEATEGARKNLMDDHLPHRKMEEVELADALIRLLDLGGSQGWNFIDRGHGDYIESADDPVHGRSVGAMHFEINKCLVELSRHVVEHNEYTDDRYSEAAWIIIHVAKLRGFDLQAAMEEKLEYNRTRADHQRENRALANGKKF